MAPSDQHGADVRFEWGRQGLEALLAGGVRTVLVVDVLRFSTAVDVACGRGAAVTPHGGDEPGVAAEAARRGAQVASLGVTGGDTSVLSLSPVSLRKLSTNDHVLLPSPNGGALSRRAAEAGAVVLAGCLRNAAAVAAAVKAFPVGVVAAGERWPDGSLRPAVEDAWGAGAIIRALSPPASPDPTLGLLAMFGGSTGPAPAPATRSRSRSLSPEAAWAAANLPTDLAEILPKTASGRELEEAGWSLDIEVAAALNVSQTAPRLDQQGTFRG